MKLQNKNDDNAPEKWSSRIPPRLPEEEKKKWEKDLKWEIEERKRREKEGFYDSEGRGHERKIGKAKKKPKRFK